MSWRDAPRGRGHRIRREAGKQQGREEDEAGEEKGRGKDDYCVLKDLPGDLLNIGPLESHWDGFWLLACCSPFGLAE